MATWQPVTAKSGNQVQYELYCGKLKGKKEVDRDIFIFRSSNCVCLDGKYLFKVKNRDSRTRSTEVVLMSILAGICLEGVVLS